VLSGTIPRTATRARLLLADDHVLLLEGMRQLLEPEFEVVGMCSDGRALLRTAEQLRPDVVLLDISMPLLNGLDAAMHLRKVLPSVQIVFVTMHADAEYVRAAFRAGGAGYLVKRCAGAELVTAVRQVLRGQTYVSSRVQGSEGGVLDLSARAADPTLTLRQREVLQLVAEGYTDKEIASLLFVSDKTVEFHKASIRKQLGLRSTAEMVRYAIKHGLTSA
jgi:DNA-binding NarL/FixJ family response regulator